ncbi:MlaC/ttg2D family ABC transporter substrate-binding protein [Pseudoalteromonas luteoviolacea]|uniref:MlaC/ttg2D family ABC transporter substrate-binding protein n=1 Tax=Pseudoalteromonas luteoviolacea TaxID=43657 RepID=UPI001153AD0B|nr:ABC transporter substrate-binding protein [Pseudoalteromonas luteoviolacea]TQF67599.1 ABC transporter substrate-binding protein [Pseudoalteromonas luteoviolacea]
MKNQLTIFLPLLLSLVMSAKGLAQQHEQSNMEAPFAELAHKLSTELISGIEDLKAVPETEQEQLALQIVHREFAPHLDLRFSSLKLLGKHIRHLEQHQMAEFTGLIENQLINMYAKVLIEYKNSEIAMQTLQTNQGRKFAEATIQLNQESRGDTRLILKFRQSAKGQWRMYDVVSRQVSQLSVKRQSLVLKISEIGFEQLNKELRQGSSNRI